ncbi:MAG: type II secretion system GspH family protein [Campylobacter sp.]|nr:type II secretion system GspH family protein [Campylobacter sp.]
MIELVFVVAILGILAAIAIPRLSNIKDGGEINKTADNLNILIHDVKQFYLMQKDFASSVDLDNMTNVDLQPAFGFKSGEVNKNYAFDTSGAECIVVSYVPFDEEFAKPAHLKFFKGKKGVDSEVCKELYKHPFVKKVLNSQFSYQEIVGQDKASGEFIYETSQSNLGEMLLEK